MFLPRALMTVVLAVSVAACRGDASRTSVTAASLDRDDFGDTIRVNAPATRIVSLSPVTTEILFAIGAGDRVVGRTHWDTYPAAARAVQDLGNGMQPNVEAILATRPDLVVIYGSPSNRAAALQLRRAGIATIAVRTDHVSDFRRATTWIARAIGDSAAGAVVSDSVEHSIAAASQAATAGTGPTVLWHLWDAPVMTIGRGSYMSELVAAAGGRNLFDDLEAPSPQVTIEEIVRRNPDYVIAGPSGAESIRKKGAWQAIPAVREGRILIVDTALVSRPGVRMGEAVRHLRTLLHPEGRR
ncbi:MAG: helical backbone metal receptor [Gemmatimonadetes bacterium]|nr:helical backbone metal receptor [Gemmatimonadota bacterium]